jgi:hypothetical protein
MLWHFKTTKQLTFSDIKRTFNSMYFKIMVTKWKLTCNESGEELNENGILL